MVDVIEARKARRRNPTAASLKRQIRAAVDPRQAYTVRWFKTGKGQYAEHDRFLGVRVPTLRSIAARFEQLPLSQIESLLSARIHEYRYAGLLILVSQYRSSAPRRRDRIFRFYLAHTAGINSWDLVDISAPLILGAHLLCRPRRILRQLAASSVQWERRMAIVTTAAFIEQGDLKDTFAIAQLLLGDTRDLIHKATGWMLREAGRQSRGQLITFLSRHYASIPRTTLRYAIEHLPAAERRRVLRGRPVTEGRHAS